MTPRKFKIPNDIEYKEKDISVIFENHLIKRKYKGIDLNKQVKIYSKKEKIKKTLF